MSEDRRKKTRGDRRKKNYHKAIRKYKLCESIWGDAKEYNDGILGKYIDGKIHDHEEYRKTNSEWDGKHNYKHGDKQRADSCEDMEREHMTNEEG